MGASITNPGPATNAAAGLRVDGLKGGPYDGTESRGGTVMADGSALQHFADFPDIVKPNEPLARPHGHFQTGRSGRGPRTTALGRRTRGGRPPLLRPQACAPCAGRRLQRPGARRGRSRRGPAPGRAGIYAGHGGRPARTGRQRRCPGRADFGSGSSWPGRSRDAGRHARNRRRRPAPKRRRSRRRNRAVGPAGRGCRSHGQGAGSRSGRTSLRFALDQSR